MGHKNSYYVIDGASLTLTCFTRGDEDDDGEYVWKKIEKKCKYYICIICILCPV